MKSEIELLAVLLAREQPRGAGDELVLVASTSALSSRRVDQVVRALVAVALVDAANVKPVSCGVRLDVVQQVLDRGVARRGDRRRAGRRASAATIIRAPRKVLPVPGGPWTGRTEWSRPSVAETSCVDVRAELAGAQPRRLAAQQRARGVEAVRRRRAATSASAMSASRRTRRPGSSASRRSARPAAGGRRRSRRGAARRGRPRRATSVVALAGRRVVDVAGRRAGTPAPGSVKSSRATACTGIGATVAVELESGRSRRGRRPARPASSSRRSK